MIVGIDHVQLAMPAGGEDAARRFYGRTLGLREVPKPPGLAARGGLWFETYGTAIHLGLEDGFRPAQKAHPALLCEDLGAMTSALRDGGCDLSWDESVEGVRRLYTHDPFGNRIEIIADGDGFSQRSPIVRGDPTD